MNIKESIIHYIGVYDGSEKRVIENTVSDHIYEFKNNPMQDKPLNRIYFGWLKINISKL